MIAPFCAAKTALGQHRPRYIRSAWKPIKKARCTSRLSKLVDGSLIDCRETALANQSKRPFSRQTLFSNQLVIKHIIQSWQKTVG